ncbi:MAG: aminopeptidase P N-terminal domain-containing protein [Cyanophyceae cyanobacterium]
MGLERVAERGLGQLGIATTPVDVVRSRRRRLFQALQKLGADFPVALWSGRAPAKNFPANRHYFRANSHFLYFAGLGIENAVIVMDAGSDRTTLFWDEPGPDDALWHGPEPSRDQVAAAVGADDARALGDVYKFIDGGASIYLPDPGARLAQEAVLGRSLSTSPEPEGIDGVLAQAIVEVRLRHDEFAIAEIKKAIAVSIQTHKLGIQSTKNSQLESHVCAKMEEVIYGNQCGTAYNSIVTIAGEVLHNNCYHNPLGRDDLLLADVGAETALGWASDITRTWPVSGKFSPTQKALYDVVLDAHDQGIAAVKPGADYREIHLLVSCVLAGGLVDLGILKGNPESLVDSDAHALFFPHGVGHLMGLDVHDMEDLGDVSGYGPGRVRSDRFGLGFLRLSRILEPNMVVTIEPGFYQVPAILNNSEWRDRYSEMVNWDRLADFSDVRGIRIEDDVLVTETGNEVLTADLPADTDSIEGLMLR